MPNVIRLPDFTSFSSAELGKNAHTWGKLWEKEIPFPPSVAIPPSTLKMIAEANNLASFLQSELKQLQPQDPVALTTIKNKIQNRADTIKVPREITRRIHQEYENYLGGEFVSISLSPTHTPLPKGELILPNITGDANIVHSILILWMEAISQLIHRAHQDVPLHEIIYPGTVVAQQVPHAQASGKAFTRNIRTRKKTSVTIQSQWGGLNPTQSEFKDEFAVDIRTNNIISRSVSPQTYHQVPTFESWEHQKLSTDKQTNPSLSDPELQRLSIYLQKIKRLFLEDQVSHWIYTGENFFICSIEEHDLAPAPHSKQQIHATATKLYISSGNPDQTTNYSSLPIDGVGVLRSEYTLAKTGVHPEHALRGPYRDLLKEELLRTLTMHQRATPGHRILYRLQNLHSGELRQLQFAERYEPQETNPYLGFRGGLKISTKPALTQFELSVFQEFLRSQKSGQHQWGILVPFVRTPSELKQIISLIEETGLLNNAHIELWLQLNTPENVTMVDQYLLKPVAGLSVNVKSIHALYHGIDPDNPDLYERYPFNLALFQEIIDTIVNKLSQAQLSAPISQQRNVILHMEEYHPQLLEYAVQRGLHGVTVKPMVAEIAKSSIIDAEEATLRKFQK